MPRSDRIIGRLALVLSLLALVIAMGGTSYAAVKLARNSVTSAIIKNNTIRGADVRDHSLAALDFRPGQLPAGPRGPQGVPGPRGAQDPAGPGAKLLPIRSAGDASYPLVAGVWLSLRCDPLFGIGSLSFDNQGDAGDALATGVSWQGASPASASQTVDQPLDLTLPGLNDVFPGGFTGTVRNTSSGAAAWVDVHVNMKSGEGCTGSMAYMPLTSTS